MIQCKPELSGENVDRPLKTIKLIAYNFAIFRNRLNCQASSPLTGFMNNIHLHIHWCQFAYTLSR